MPSINKGLAAQQAAINLNMAIAAELNEPKRINALIALNSWAISRKLDIAIGNNDWHLIALIALSQIE